MILASAISLYSDVLPVLVAFPLGIYCLRKVLKSRKEGKVNMLALVLCICCIVPMFVGPLILLDKLLGFR